MKLCSEGNRLYEEYLVYSRKALLLNAVMLRVVDVLGIDSPATDAVFYTMMKLNQERDEKAMSFAVHLYECKGCQELSDYIDTELGPNVFVELMRAENESKN